MKSTTVLLSILLIFCLNSCSQDFKKVSDSEVDKQNLQIAQEFATSYLSKLKNGEFYQFRNEAIDALKNQLTEENQKAVYKKLKDQFGDFQSLEYSETWIQSNDNSMQIFRFKSDFEKSNKKLEVRVVLDSSQKIAGFWIKPWSDIL